jgi:Tfp pilus assembly protein PilF
MRRSFSWQLSILLLVGVAAGAQVDHSTQSVQLPGSPPPDTVPLPAASEAPTKRTTNLPGVTVTGRAPHDETSLPALPPDEFTDCMSGRGALDLRDPGALSAMAVCEAKLDWEKRIVVDRCLNRDGKSVPPLVVQACTESLDRKIFQGRDRFYLFVNRAEAYFAQGDRQRALEDYNSAIKLAPKNAKLYYNRGVFYAAQTNAEAALRDLDTALSINPKFVVALQQRAKIYLTQDNFDGALADYSEAVRLQPKTAVLWSERGYVCLRQGSYDSAIKDETEAIRLDPKLARAYFLRGAAFGDLGNTPNALSDIVIAVRLDPSLDRYISSKGKTALLTLPPE